MILYIAFATPLHLGFEVAPDAAGEALVTAVFTCDIFFNFVTGYATNGMVEGRKLKIALHYMKVFPWTRTFIVVGSVLVVVSVV
jgi:hypothetical protein